MVEEKTLLSDSYVVFDLETTGLYPNSGDTIIEIGAVKISDGKIIDRFDELINPGRNLSEEIIKITGIDNEMLKGKRNEEEVLNDELKVYLTKNGVTTKPYDSIYEYVKGLPEASRMYSPFSSFL